MAKKKSPRLAAARVELALSRVHALARTRLPPGMLSIRFEEARVLASEVTALREQLARVVTRPSALVISGLHEIRRLAAEQLQHPKHTVRKAIAWLDDLLQNPDTEGKK